MNVTLKMALDSNMFAGNKIEVFFFNEDTIDWEKKFSMFLGDDPVDHSKIQTRRSPTNKNRFLDCIEFFFPLKKDFARAMKSGVSVKADGDTLKLFVSLPEDLLR